MQLFLIMAPTCAILALGYAYYDKNGMARARGALGRGLLASPFVLLAGLILGWLLPEWVGSPLSALSEAARRYIPYASLPLALYGLFYLHAERLPRHERQLRLAAFQAGCLAPQILVELVRSYGRPEPYSLFFVPLLLAASLFAGPGLGALLVEGYGFGRFACFAGLLLWPLAAGLTRWLLLSGHWPLAVVLALALAFLAWFPGWRSLRPARVLLPPKPPKAPPVAETGDAEASPQA